MGLPALTRYCIVLFLCLYSTACFAAPKNPHRHSQDCGLCHDSPDFGNPRRMCFSCHRCSRSGDMSFCLECHEHHWTSDIIMLLKKKWAHAEVAKYSVNAKAIHTNNADCQECHRGSPETARNLISSVNIICRKCHAEINCQHPVGIAITVYMNTKNKLSLDSENKINCVTCHRINCKDDHCISIPGFSRRNGLQTNEMCYTCHEHINGNPHEHTAQQRNCQLCHSSLQKGRGFDKTLDSKLLCLLCHPERPHPAQKSHKGVFPFKKRAKMKDLRLDSSGRMTCFSCHNPHGNKRPFYAEGPSCAECHTKYFL